MMVRQKPSKKERGVFAGKIDFVLKRLLHEVHNVRSLLEAAMSDHAIDAFAKMSHFDAGFETHPGDLLGDDRQQRHGFVEYVVVLHVTGQRLWDSGACAEVSSCIGPLPFDFPASIFIVVLSAQTLPPARDNVE